MIIQIYKRCLEKLLRSMPFFEEKRERERTEKELILDTSA